MPWQGRRRWSGCWRRPSPARVCLASACRSGFRRPRRVLSYPKPLVNFLPARDIRRILHEPPSGSSKAAAWRDAARRGALPAALPRPAQAARCAAPVRRERVAGAAMRRGRTGGQSALQTRCPERSQGVLWHDVRRAQRWRPSAWDGSTRPQSVPACADGSDLVCSCMNLPQRLAELTGSKGGSTLKPLFAPRACSLSPHIVLIEAGLPFDKVKADTKTKAMDGGGDYKTVNPLGYVPALQLDDGSILTEGPAIVQFIADKVPDKKLAPANGTLERTRLQSWL